MTNKTYENIQACILYYELTGRAMNLAYSAFFCVTVVVVSLQCECTASPNGICRS